jgi:hypothetical protein
MDQLSDSYKRNITYLTLAIGLILALVVNADSLQMARSLWEDSSLRAAASAIAQQAINTGQVTAPTATPLAPAAEATLDPNAINAGAAAVSNAQAEPNEQDISSAAAQALNALNQLTSLNLPIGWEFTPIAATCFPEADQDQPPPIECSSMRNIWLLGPSNNPDWFGLLIKKLIGIAATVIAIGQGAPFWFDLIRRLVRPSG